MEEKGKKETFNDFALTGTAVAIGSFLVANIYVHFSLLKNLKNISLVEPSLGSKELKNRTVDKYRVSKEASACIDEFLRMFEKCEHVDLTNFYLTLRACSISKGKKIFGLYPRCDGFFDVSDCSIKYFSLKIRYVIFHELIHMAGHRFSDTHWICGFHQIKKTKSLSTHRLYDIGNALDEGYVQLLTERYFSNYAIKRGYGLFVDVARYIEVLVGQKRMEELYFKADLSGLVEYLANYASKEEVLALLTDLDYIWEALKHKIIPLPRIVASKKYQGILKKISSMLIHKIEIEEDMSETDTRDLIATFYSVKNHVKVYDSLRFLATKNTKFTLDKMVKSSAMAKEKKLKFKQIG